MAKKKSRASEQAGSRNSGRFKKGQSGNPGGRPKGSEEFRKLCRDHTEEALETLLRWMRSRNGKVAVAAANSLLDRGWGKATQPLSGEDGKPLMQPVINITVGNERQAYRGSSGQPRPASPPKAG